MGRTVAKRIEAWFREHDEDGEFAWGDRERPYSVIGAADPGAGFVFTTKTGALAAAIAQCAAPAPGMVGRYGLPGDGDLVWIGRVIGSRPLVFLGDMDPVDLLVFAWLRNSLRPGQVAHLGVSDAMLRAFGLASARSLSISCSPSEQESLDFLTGVLPDAFELVGPRCAALLKGGRKIELEVISRRLAKAKTALPILLRSANFRPSS